MKKTIFLPILPALLVSVSVHAQRLDTLFTGDLRSVSLLEHPVSLPSLLDRADNDEDEIHPPKHTVYKVKPAVTIPIIAGGTAYSLYMLTLLTKKPAITDDEFNHLHPELFQGFDSWVLHQHVGDLTALENYSVITQVSAALLPLTVFFDEKIRNDFADILMIYMEVNAIDVTIYMSPLGPVFQNKFRPLVYYTNLPESQRTGGSRNSFYSGHVAAAVADMYAMAKFFCDYHPEIDFGGKLLIYTAASIPGLTMTYFRLRALDHFLSDVVVGWGIGATCGIVIPQLHRIHSKNMSIGTYVSPTSSGFSFSWNLDHQ